MKKQIIEKLILSEGAISGFFQKLPELFILILIPVALFVYIFVRPQMMQDNQKKAEMQNAVYENNTNSSEEKVDDSIRALLGDAQRQIISGTESARLENISTPSANTTNTLPNLDLVGPWTCASGDANGNAMKLYIQSKSLKFISQSSKGTEQFLVSDGCLYTWVDNGMGKKQCTGIADAIAIAELATQSGLIDVSEILEQMGGDMTGGMKPLLSSCKKLIVNATIFSVPQGIKWEQDNTLLEGVK